MNLILCAKKTAALVAASVSLAVLSACHSSHSAQFDAGEQTFPLKVAPYNAYLKQVERYIEKNRVFIGENTSQAQEIAMNMPFECGTQHTETGVLLVHGLGDSPYFFVMSQQRCVLKEFMCEPYYFRGTVLNQAICCQ
ncbi:hypothetical protein [Alteromonas gracilis]|uniref:hypothetical protein n=1 Tax=Alteromonas gracilis TaxID=1479524 RepID=UPI0030D050AF